MNCRLKYPDNSARARRENNVQAITAKGLYLS